MCVRHTRVRPAVPLQLVAPREAFSTEDPVADERPLPGVPAQVSSQVRRLAVDFPAALHVAHMLLLFRWVSVVSVETGLHLKLRATVHNSILTFNPSQGFKERKKKHSILTRV